MGVTWWCSWLRYCTTSWQVVGSILDGVIGISHWHNISGHSVALWSTQTLTETSSRNISWGIKAASAEGWQHYHYHVQTVFISGSLHLLEPSGPIQTCTGIALPFLFTHDRYLNCCWKVHMSPFLEHSQLFYWLRTSCKIQRSKF
jgi:hypothetical protein